MYKQIATTILLPFLPLIIALCAIPPGIALGHLMEPQTPIQTISSQIHTIAWIGTSIALLGIFSSTLLKKMHSAMERPTQA